MIPQFKLQDFEILRYNNSFYTCYSDKIEYIMKQTFRKTQKKNIPHVIQMKIFLYIYFYIYIIYIYIIYIYYIYIYYIYI